MNTTQLIKHEYDVGALKGYIGTGLLLSYFVMPVPMLLCLVYSAFSCLGVYLYFDRTALLISCTLILAQAWYLTRKRGQGWLMSLLVAKGLFATLGAQTPRTYCHGSPCRGPCLIHSNPYSSHYRRFPCLCSSFAYASSSCHECGGDRV